MNNPDIQPTYNINPRADMQYNVASNQYEQQPLMYEKPMKADFDDQVRLGFVRKVYALVTGMLIIAFGMAIIPAFAAPVATFIYTIPGYVLLGIACVGMIVSMCMTFCFKRAPANYILLVIFTITMGYILMFCCGVFNQSQSGDPNSKWTVVIAVGATISVTLVITVITLLFKEKVVLCALIGVAILMPVVWFMMLQFWLFSGSYWMYPVFTGVAILLASLIIVIDTYFITSRLCVDEYIIAAIILFMDIIRLFIYILAALGSKK
jgi:protein lifeguard